MFDVIPYWMWATSLLTLAVVCGAALSEQAPRVVPRRVRSRARTR